MGQHLDVSEVTRMVVSMDGFDDRLKKRARAAIQKASADTKRDAQILAPVDTGNLRSSGTYSTKELATAVVGEIGFTADYALFVEDGTSTQEPQPYLRPAVMRNVGPLADALAQANEDFFG